VFYADKYGLSDYGKFSHKKGLPKAAGQRYKLAEGI
jgi:hypothetical protein